MIKKDKLVDVDKDLDILGKNIMNELFKSIYFDNTKKKVSSSYLDVVLLTLNNILQMNILSDKRIIPAISKQLEKYHTTDMYIDNFSDEIINTASREIEYLFEDNYGSGEEYTQYRDGLETIFSCIKGLGSEKCKLINIFTEFKIIKIFGPSDYKGNNTRIDLFQQFEDINTGDILILEEEDYPLEENYISYALHFYMNYPEKRFQMAIIFPFGDNIGKQVFINYSYINLKLKHREYSDDITISTPIENIRNIKVDDFIEKINEVCDIFLGVKNNGNE